MTTTEEEAPLRGLRRVMGDRGASVASRQGRPLRQRLRLPLMLAGPIVVLIAASWWYLTSGRYVSTDDAYVQAARTMISSDISGRVVAIAVHDNQRVARARSCSGSTTGRTASRSTRRRRSSRRPGCRSRR